MVFPANLAFNFHSGISISTTSCFQIQICTWSKIWKKNLFKCRFLCLFTTLYLIWPKFCPKDHIHFFFFFFSDFQLNMLGDSKLVKPLKNCFFGPNHSCYGWKWHFFRKKSTTQNRKAFITQSKHMIFC